MKGSRLDESNAIPANPGEIQFESNRLGCSFCLDPACMKILPEMLKDDSEGLLDKSCERFTLTIHGKLYKFPNDKRVINGITNRIQEIIKKHDKSEH